MGEYKGRQVLFVGILKTNCKIVFWGINFMTRSHTDKEQLSSMFAFLHTYLKYSGKLNMLDENKVMEDIMCEVLNRVYLSLIHI